MSEMFDLSKGKGIKIVVVDSGIDKNHPVFKNCIISNESFSVSNKNFKLEIEKDINDEYGHGTAVCGILYKLVPQAEFIIVKIFDNPSLTAEEDKLVFALDYIIKNIQCDIIHMSFGVVIPSDTLHNRCKVIKQKNIIMVGAYDNAGAISYPAYYPEVIGVDSDVRCTKVDDFFVLKNYNTTIFAKSGNHRLAWIDSRYIISQGSSFSAGYVTAYIARMLSCGKKNDEIIPSFQAIAKKSVSLAEYILPNVMCIPFEIKNAAIFPYNKEMHSLVRYSDKLSFNISAICDSKFTGRIGKKVKNSIGTKQYVIEALNKINWNQIDTLILGHLNEMENTIGYSLKGQIVELIKKHHLNIYAFDDNILNWNMKDLIDAEPKIYIPAIENADHAKKNMGKLFQSRKPILGIFGTSSKQGKFTLQLALRYSFMKINYSVAQLGTEPSSLLFGLDGCFPFGYNGMVKVVGNEFIATLNSLLHEIDEKRTDADIILVGSQSGTTPMLYNNLEQLTVPQLEFLIGSMPDAVILCINPDDEIDYIMRTIQTIEGVGSCEVIALAMFPLSYANGWQLMNDLRTPAENINDIRESMSLQIKKEIFIMNDDGNIDNLRDLCIEYLSE